MLNFDIIQSDPVTIISLIGRFDSSGASVFEGKFDPIKSIFPVLDFSKVNFLSSAGIRVLIKSEKSLRQKNGKIILCSVAENIKQVLEVTGLLNQFTLLNSQSEATELVLKLQEAAKSTFNFVINNNTYSVKYFGGSAAAAEIWLPDEQDRKGLIAANLEEFRFAIGEGGLGITREQVETSTGKIILTKNFIGLIPEKGESDYLFSKNPSDSFLYIKSAVNFSGKPNIFIQTANSEITFGEVIRNSLLILSDKNDVPVNSAGFVLAADFVSKEKQGGLISIGTISDKLTGNTPVSLIAAESIYLDDNISCNSLGITLQNSGTNPGEDVDDYIKNLLCEENISEVITPGEGLALRNIRIWLFLPEYLYARDKRLKICFEDNIEVKDEFEVITRKIYSDCSSITLKQLHGGFSAKTFQVFGYDKRGIRILPTVLKLAKRGTVKREVVNYEEHVKRYILNNSTSILGNYYYGDFGGVRYNFVGITGPDSKIGWLTDLYKTKSPEELLPLFDRIFTDILRPWYGQPRLETFYAFKEHNPTAVFFPELFEKCEEELGISADHDKVYFEELGREIINPYWFLKYGYREREKKAKLWYKCICHGDLNMQNILLDEIRNVYIIDYSETSFRNAVADFARLEPIFKFEFPVITKDELKNLIQFEKGLLTVDKLDEMPEFTYVGTDPFIKKAYKIICRLRKYANTVTLFENDLIPYLLAVLEWTYAVVCYQSVDNIVKRYSAISAALICEKILQLENQKPV